MIHPFLKAAGAGMGLGVLGVSMAKDADPRGHFESTRAGADYYPAGTRNWFMGGAAMGVAGYAAMRYGVRAGGAMNSAAQAARQFRRDARSFGTVLTANKGMGKITGLFKGFFPSVA